MRRWSIRTLAITVPFYLALGCSSKESAKPAATEEDPADETEGSDPTDTATDSDTCEGVTGLVCSPVAPPETREVYEPKEVPAEFAPVLPGTLALANEGNGLRLQGEMGDAGEVYPDPEEAPTPEEPSAAESMGLSEVQSQAGTLNDKFVDHTKYLNAVDQIIDANPDCMEAEGCTITGATMTLTEAMVNDMIDSAGGEIYFLPEDLETLKALADTEISLGTVTVTHPTEGSYGSVATIDDGEGAVRIYSWSDDKTAVGIDESIKFSWQEEDMDGSSTSHNFEQSWKLNFSVADGTVTVANKFTMDQDQASVSFVVRGDADSEANGVALGMKDEWKSGDADGFYYEVSGYADDAGGYIRTAYSFDDYAVTLTLSAASELGVNYGIYPADATAEALNADQNLIWEQQLGGFMGDGELSPAGAYYFGPAGDDFPADGLPLYTIDYLIDEDTMEFSTQVTAVDTAVNKVESATLTKTRTTAGYEESFDGEGSVTDFCYYEGGDFEAAGECVGDISSDYVEDYEGYAGEDGEIAAIGGLVAGVDGVTYGAVRGTYEIDFIRVGEGEDAATVVASLNAALADPSVEGAGDAWAHVVGSGGFIGVGDEDDADSINDLFSIYFWGTLEDATGGVVVQLVFDENGAALYEIVDGASFVVWEVTEDNADATFEDIVADSEG